MNSALVMCLSPLVVLIENSRADPAVTITAHICNRVYPLRIRRQGLCRAKPPRKCKISALSTYAGRIEGVFRPPSGSLQHVGGGESLVCMCDVHASLLLRGREHGNFERLT